MAMAIELGRQGLGLCAPNPAVGAVLVKDHVIVGRGWTKRGGRPHAETEALRDAGEKAHGATLYVSLEPCSHHGVTPPCAEAIIQAGVVRVVSAQEDPDPRVAGCGHAMLRNAGIDVICGLMAREARQANLGHILRVSRGRPMLTLKLAMTADGYAAGVKGAPRLKITGEAANRFTHKLRAEHDAILIGSGTAREDDPLLTVRLPGMEDRKPLRIILDSNLSLSPQSQLAATADRVPTWVIGGEGASEAAAAALRGAQIEVILLPRNADQQLDLGAVIQQLAARGLTRIFCEAGPTLARALIANGFADAVILLKSPEFLGGEGRLALTPEIEAMLNDFTQFECVEKRQIGTDWMSRYERVF
jgi:diaminohydroxyphosphoribosylaminopyrimidine deaminase/5-amino-6-(5-phosphoribosylamino)uracil reductase